MSMPKQDGDAVTVIDVARFMGMELPKKTAWEVGSAVREAYRSHYKCYPPKELRPKTAGRGSHCFAVYPRTFVPIIIDAITRAGAEKERQQKLF